MVRTDFKAKMSNELNTDSPSFLLGLALILFTIT